MSVDAPPISDLPDEESHLVTYPAFLWECFKISFDGGPLFYIWMTILTGVALVGVTSITRRSRSPSRS